MDAEAIQEIANQLGITVNAVTKEVIPAFVQFETANYIFGAILFGCLFALTLTLTIFFIKKGIIEKRNEDDDSSLYFIIGAIAGFCATIFFVLLFCSISSIALWAYYPYGSFINYILNQSERM